MPQESHGMDIVVAGLLGSIRYAEMKTHYCNTIAVLPAGKISVINVFQNPNPQTIQNTTPVSTFRNYQ